MSEGEKVLRDPVYGYVYIHDPLIWDVVNTPEVQRLRRIRQLGPAYLTYPGGEHSRFSHVLGTYEVVRRLLQAFDRERQGLAPERARLAMVAGLLHDVGHGPFSHALEPLWGPSHEEWGARLLADPTTALHQVLAAYEPSLPGRVADVILKRHPDRLVTSLVSGQLDADRLDYLRRDALYCGVDYGQFNLDRILRVVHPLDDRVVVKKTGLQTVEAYLLARYFMYGQVYFHPVCRSAEVVLRQVMARARALAARGEAPRAPWPLDRWLGGAPLEVGEYLALDDNHVMVAFEMWRTHPDSVLADLAARIPDRRLFRYTELPAGGNPRVFGRVERAVADGGFDPAYYLQVDEALGVYYDYYLGGEGRGGSEPLYVWDGVVLTEMSRLSRPVQAISRERQGHRRLYFPAEVEAAVLRELGQ
ncbi:MAG: HD domain-containing protein [Thermaerobacter sp.]|nr:HD domain-containing protein [Thermaerobacter sp.]